MRGLFQASRRSNTFVPSNKSRLSKTDSFDSTSWVTPWEENSLTKIPLSTCEEFRVRCDEFFTKVPIEPSIDLQITLLCKEGRYNEAYGLCVSEKNFKFVYSSHMKSSKNMTPVEFKQYVEMWFNKLEKEYLRPIMIHLSRNSERNGMGVIEECLGTDKESTTTFNELMNRYRRAKKFFHGHALQQIWAFRCCEVSVFRNNSMVLMPEYMIYENRVTDLITTASSYVRDLKRLERQYGDDIKMFDDGNLIHQPVTDIIRWPVPTS